MNRSPLAEAYVGMLPWLEWLENQLVTVPLPPVHPPELLAERVGELSELQKGLEHVLKQVKQARATADKVFCVSRGLTMTDSVKSEHFKVTAKEVNPLPTLKRKGNEEIYDRVVREVLGVTDENIVQSGAITLHYKHWAEFERRMLEEHDVQMIPTELESALTRYTEYRTRVNVVKSLLASDDVEDEVPQEQLPF